MFISKRKHEEIVRSLDARLASEISEHEYMKKVASDRKNRLDEQAYLIDSLDKENRSVRRQLAEALSELHALKAKRARANAEPDPRRRQSKGKGHGRSGAAEGDAGVSKPMHVYGTLITEEQIAAGLSAMRARFRKSDVDHALVRAGVPHGFVAYRAADRLLQKQRKAGAVRAIDNKNWEQVE